jgi:hypothetical protein
MGKQVRAFQREALADDRERDLRDDIKSLRNWLNRLLAMSKSAPTVINDVR